jgi:ABC-type lipoprotein export system ATPase subunit
MLSSHAYHLLACAVGLVCCLVPLARSAKGNVIHCTNIHKTYLLGVEGVPALRGVSLSIQRGEWIIILGSSGGGKTSLLNILGTIDRPTKGELHICGHRQSARGTSSRRAH